jgi:hypothetical protein
VWICTQSNITNIAFTGVHNTNTEALIDQSRLFRSYFLRNIIFKVDIFLFRHLVKSNDERLIIS